MEILLEFLRSFVLSVGYFQPAFYNIPIYFLGGLSLFSGVKWKVSSGSFTVGKNFKGLSNYSPETKKRIFSSKISKQITNVVKKADF